MGPQPTSREARNTPLIHGVQKGGYAVALLLFRQTLLVVETSPVAQGRRLAKAGPSLLPSLRGYREHWPTRLLVANAVLHRPVPCRSVTLMARENAFGSTDPGALTGRAAPRRGGAARPRWGKGSDAFVCAACPLPLLLGLT